MAEGEIGTQRYDDDFMQRLSENRKPRSFPVEFLEKLTSVFSQFEYEPGKLQDIRDYVFSANIDDALEDAIPMFSFFSMCANKAKEREEYYSESLKTLEAPKGGTEKISVQKGGVRRSDLFQRTQKARRMYAKVRRDCEDMASAMEMRYELARTKSVNARIGLRSDWPTKQ